MNAAQCIHWKNHTQERNTSWMTRKGMAREVVWRPLRPFATTFAYLAEHKIGIAREIDVGHDFSRWRTCRVPQDLRERHRRSRATTAHWASLGRGRWLSSTAH